MGLTFHILISYLLVSIFFFKYKKGRNVLQQMSTSRHVLSASWKEDTHICHLRLNHWMPTICIQLEGEDKGRHLVNKEQKQLSLFNLNILDKELKHVKFPGDCLIYLLLNSVLKLTISFAFT